MLMIKKSKRPIIGVTGPDGWLNPAWWFTRWAIWRAGARAMRLTPSRSTLPKGLAGIIIGGGNDIAPDLYDELFEPENPPRHDPARDAFEKRVLEKVLATGLPVLGICRGAQLLNVVLGGNLHQDIRTMRRKTSNRRTPFARKTLLVQPQTRLHKILGSERCRINSLHYQAINRLGKGLRVAARDLDGLVQAVEGEGFRLGVQWHPEYLPLRRPQRRLFKALVDAAR